MKVNHLSVQIAGMISIARQPTLRAMLASVCSTLVNLRRAKLIQRS